MCLINAAHERKRMSAPCKGMGLWYGGLRHSRIVDKAEFNLDRRSSRKLQTNKATRFKARITAMKGTRARARTL